MKEDELPLVDTKTVFSKKKQLKRLKKKYAKLQKKLNAAYSRIENFEEDNGYLKGQVEQYHSQLKELSENFLLQAKEYRRICDSYKNTNEQYSQLNNMVNQFNEKYQKKISEYIKLETVYKGTFDNNSKLNKQIIELEKELES